MIPTQTLETYPIFGSNGTKVQPGDAKMAAGFQQADVLPAEWMNWEWNKNSRLITELQEGVESIETEINNLLTGVGITPAEATTNQLLTAIKKMTYPVGSVYQNMLDPTNPATLLGFGTWVQINDKFLVAAAAASFTDGTNVPKYSGTNTGGNTTYTLSEANIPKHRFYIDHTHGTVAHTHTRGSMEITAYAEFANASSVQTGCISVASGAFTKSARPSSQEFMISSPSAYTQTGHALGFAASASWVGETSAAAPSTGTASLAYTDYYGVDNPTAISIVPPYQAVYTWYRTA